MSLPRNSGSRAAGRTVPFSFSKSSGQAVAYYNVGRVLRDNNQEDLSRRYLQHALALNPNYPEAQQMLASLSGASNGVVSVGFQAAESGVR